MAQPKPYPGDAYIKTLFSAQSPLHYDPLTGNTQFIGEILTLDQDRNLVIGQNVTISGSVGNTITADNAFVTDSHNNILNAKNVAIENSSGCRVDGADHTIKRSNYCNVDGDAHWIEDAYGSTTRGFGNTNHCEYGDITGNNNRLGKQGVFYTGSSIKGTNNIVEGDNSHCIGSFIRIFGNNITVIGNGTLQNPLTFTTSGVHIV